MAWGCITVDSTRVYYAKYSQSLYELVENDLDEAIKSFEKLEEQKGGCRWGKATEFSEEIISKEKLIILVAAKVDSNWLNQTNPDPKVPPQSHMVKSRTIRNYKVTHKNFTIDGSAIFYSKPLIVEGENLSQKLDIELNMLGNSSNFGILTINTESSNTTFKAEFPIEEKLSLSVAPHGDTHHYLKLLNANFTPLARALCNVSLDFPDLNTQYSNCIDPYTFTGHAILLKTPERIKAWGIISGPPKPLPTIGGICSVFSPSAYIGHLHISPEIDYLRVSGKFKIDTGVNITLVLNEHGRMNLDATLKKHRIKILEQKIVFSKNILGEEAYLEIDGENMGNCIVGVASKLRQESEDDDEDEYEDEWELFICIALAAALISALAYLAHRKYRYQPLHAQEEIEL